MKGLRPSPLHLSFPSALRTHSLTPYTRTHHHPHRLCWRAGARGQHAHRGQRHGRRQAGHDRRICRLFAQVSCCGVLWCFCVSFCPSVCLSVCPSVCLSVSCSVYVFAFVLISLSLSLSLSVSVFLFLSLSLSFSLSSHSQHTHTHTQEIEIESV